MAFNFIKSGVLSENELKKITQESETYKDNVMKASITNGKTSSYDENRRVSNIYFPETWEAPKTYNIIQSLIIQEYAESALNVGSLSEFQYVVYPVGGKFEWHSDIVYRPDEDGRVRGLTMSINLSEDSSYEGGELLIKTHKENIITLGRKKGSYIIFPAFLTHKACEVTSGKREAIVIWTKLTYKEINQIKKEYEDNIRNNLL